MSERLVDIMKNDEVVHTFPITVGSANSSAPDSLYKTKAVAAAACAQLVPENELSQLSARMHVDRSGALEPFGDHLSVECETKHSLNQAIRSRAYYLWEQAGRPSDHTDDFWKRAREDHIRERAYTLWHQEGSPEGRADEFWDRTSAFENY